MKLDYAFTLKERPLSLTLRPDPKTARLDVIVDT